MLIFYIDGVFFYIYSFSFLFKLGRYLGHYLCYYLASSSFFYIYAIPSAFIVVVVIILCKCQLKYINSLKMFVCLSIFCYICNLTFPKIKLTSNILPQRFNEQLQTCRALISLKLHGYPKFPKINILPCRMIG